MKKYGAYRVITIIDIHVPPSYWGTGHTLV